MTPPRPIMKRLIDVKQGDRVLGIGFVQSVKIEKEVVELVVKDLAVEKAGGDPLQTYRWKGSQLVDVAQGDDHVEQVEKETKPEVAFTTTL